MLLLLLLLLLLASLQRGQSIHQGRHRHHRPSRI